MFKNIAEAVGESSVLGWVLAGTAVIVLAPTLTNVLRGVAVGTAKGVLSLAEGGSSLASNMKKGWDGIVSDAKAQKNGSAIDPNTALGAGAGGALGATVGGMAGPVGAAVGGGLGGVVGANVANDLSQDGKKEGHKNHDKAPKSNS